nr:glutathione S-transferase zeta class-like [Tanacetum cinerariifolium]
MIYSLNIGLNNVSNSIIDDVCVVSAVGTTSGTSFELDVCICLCGAGLNMSCSSAVCAGGNDLLTSNHGSDLYTIFLQEKTLLTLLYLMAKVSPTQAWLWHQRLSHLNFDYITLLSKKDVVIGLPKLKYVKDQLCSSCDVSKAKRSSFKTKIVPSSKGRLNLLHMDLCGAMRIASINGKKYILVRGKRTESLDEKGDERTGSAVFVPVKFITLESLLKDHAGKYATGDEIMLADVYLAPFLIGYPQRYNFDLSKFPLLSRLGDAYIKVPAIENAIPEKQPDFPIHLGKTVKEVLLSTRR